MSNTQPSSSPKKPDGTTDWDVVFDDPDRGLISLIAQVRNVDALHECTLFMIKRLFTRKNDQLAVARFTKNLDDIISNAGAVGDFEVIRAEVVLMLRQIKAERVEKARQYIEQKNRQHRANRRSENARAANTYRLINHPRFMPTVIGSAVCLSALIIGFMFLLIDPDEKAATDDPQQVLEPKTVVLSEEEMKQREKDEAKRKAQAEMAAKVAEATRLRDEKRKQIEEQKAKRIMPPALVLKGIFFQPQGKDKSWKSVSLLPIVLINDRKNLSSVCSMSPIIADAINIALSESMAAQTVSKPLDLDGLGNRVRKQVNAQVSREFIEKLILVEAANHRDLAIAGNKCEYASDRYFDYIYPPETKD